MAFWKFDIPGTLVKTSDTLASGYGYVGIDATNQKRLNYNMQLNITSPESARNVISKFHTLDVRGWHYLGFPEGRVNLIRVFAKTDIHGKYVLCNYKMTSSVSKTVGIYIYDGSYDVASVTDFPRDGTIPVKGNGLLQTVHTLTGTNKSIGQFENILNQFSVNVLVDVSGAAGSDVTFMIRG